MSKSNLNLSKEEAIRNHRDMWNWIYNETLKREQLVGKDEYFMAHNINNWPKNKCYCCEYTQVKNLECNNCIIDWGNPIGCCCEDSPYIKLQKYYSGINKDKDDLEHILSLVREIANLPEREV